MRRYKLVEDFKENDGYEFSPSAGIMPSQRGIPCSRGADVDAIFKQMDYENILREVSKYPVAARKQVLHKLLTRRRRMYGE